MPKELLSKVLATLPPEWSEDPTPGIMRLLQSYPAKLVIIDDDPTGSQSVYDIPLLTRWSTNTLERQLGSDSPAFFILTNSRALPEDQAGEINLEIGQNLRKASFETGKKFVVVSRGDSTLRGYFPTEVEALSHGLQIDFDAWLLVPALPSEGRVTIDGVHYVAMDNWLTPIGETAYAQDPTFGFHSSDLRDWIEEKTAGRIPASQVQSVSIADIRQGGPTRVSQRLLDLPKGTVCVIDAVSNRDLEVFTAGLLAAEALGRQFLYRSGPGLLPIRMGIQPSKLLSAEMLPLGAEPVGGLVVVGSYVPNTSKQVAMLQERSLTQSIEVDVARLLHTATKQAEVACAAEQVDSFLANGQDVLLYTSREVMTGETPEASLQIGQVVSRSLIEILDQISIRPRYILAKGGITSNDIATQSLGVKCAMVMGQIVEGVSVWQLGPESRFEGLIYIVFPGNTGQPETLAEVVQKLKRDDAGFINTNHQD